MNYLTSGQTIELSVIDINDPGNSRKGGSSSNKEVTNKEEQDCCSHPLQGPGILLLN